MNEFRIKRKLMGSAFELIINHDHKDEAAELLALGVSEISRIEKLLTEFSEDSVTTHINRNAGIQSVDVPEEVFNLLNRCIKISKITQGAFDITTGPLKQLFDFRRNTFQFPDQKSLSKALKITGYSNIHLGKNQSVYLLRKGMKISFAAIGKGYAADQVKKLWLLKGVVSGVINASGDLTTIGKRTDGSAWKIGIPNPAHKEEMLVKIKVEDGSVATSGDYEQYFMKDGKRYSHTINPVTGLPVSGIQSVTITGISAELCDALATAVTVMGTEVGLHFIEQLPKTHCLIIDDSNNIHYSKNINFEKSN